MAQYTPMIQQYLRIKEEYKDTFLFFRLGDFYEMFFEDAEMASQELEITLTSRVGGKEDKIPMCGVPYHSAEQYIRKLIDKGYKVALCEQVEDPKQAQGVVKREVIRVITPGTIMDKSMLSEREHNYILFLAKKEGQVALVGCELSTGEVTGTQMNELDLLVDEAKQFQAAELIIADSLSEREKEKIQTIFNQPVTIKKIKNDDQALQNWISTLSIMEDHQEYSQAMWLTIRLMYEYLDETQKRSMDHLQRFTYYEANGFLKLDTYSRRNLELIETIRDHSRNGSLLWLLDQTSTAMGGRLIKKWVQKPLMSRRKIEERLDAVSSFVTYSFEREELSQTLKEVYDLERLAGRVSYGNVNPRDLLQLKKSLLAIPVIVKQLGTFPSDSVQHILKGIDTCQELASLLENALQEEPPLSIKEGGIFRSGYHKELDTLQEANRNGKTWIAELEAQERRATGIRSLKVGYNKVFGYYIEVTKANIHLLEEGRYERKQTLANAERFVTQELKEKESLILEANDRLMDLEYQLFLELRSEVNEYTHRLQKLAERISQIDVLSSFAKVSEKYHYTRPTFTNDGTLSIKQGRHPVVERVLNQSHFVANDLVMDRESRQTLLITGPNMAGKSTYMRQMALIAIMAQVGCFVPAEKATLPLFDQIFTRIGAADDLVGGQSTFMVEMLETRQAITQATSNSLILLDEIGRGTSTYDGMSLAQAVVEYIHDHVQAKTLFSTHYHELTNLEDELATLQNVHVACSEKEGRVIFLHTVKEGKADRSYGIHVAQLADMPEEVINKARKILQGLESGQAYANPGQAPHQREIKEEPAQLSLFESLPEPLSDEFVSSLQEIERLEIATMTPMEALNTLFNIQQKLKLKK